MYTSVHSTIISARRSSNAPEMCTDFSYQCFLCELITSQRWNNFNFPKEVYDSINVLIGKAVQIAFSCNQNILMWFRCWN